MGLCRWFLGACPHTLIISHGIKTEDCSVPKPAVPHCSEGHRPPRGFMKVSSLRRKTRSRSWGCLMHCPCRSPFSADSLPQMNQGRSGPPSSQVQEEGGQRRLQRQETIFILRF